MPVPISFARLLFLSGITSVRYGSTHHLVGPIELFKLSKYHFFFSPWALIHSHSPAGMWKVLGELSGLNKMLGTSEGLKVYAFEFECNF